MSRGICRPRVQRGHSRQSSILIRAADLEHSFFLKGGADQLQAGRQVAAGKTAGKAQDRVTREPDVVPQVFVKKNARVLYSAGFFKNREATIPASEITPATRNGRVKEPLRSAR